MAPGAACNRAESAVAQIAPIFNVGSLTDWLTATDTSDETISRIDRAAVALAEAHAQFSPAILLAEVSELHNTTQSTCGPAGYGIGKSANCFASMVDCWRI